MSIHRLLDYDRWEVINLWPGANFGKGYIFEVPEGDRYTMNGHSELVFQDFPYLFKKLHWADHRTPEELPHVVKIEKGTNYFCPGDVVTVKRWELLSLTDRIYYKTYWAAWVVRREHLSTPTEGHKFYATQLIPTNEKPL